MNSLVLERIVGSESLPGLDPKAPPGNARQSHKDQNVAVIVTVRVDAMRDRHFLREHAEGSQP
jgi:hypothetical protein